MILKLNQNTPICAPQFSNMTAALADYRVFTDEPLYSMADFLAFITTPSPERDEFLERFNVTVTVMNNKYVKRVYTLA